MATRQRAEHMVAGILSDVTAACSAVPEPLAADASEASATAATLSPALIGRVVKAVVLHPEHGFAPERELSDADLAAITRRCVDRLSDAGDAGVATLRLQVDVDATLQSHGKTQTYTLRVVLKSD